jgi:DNA polymerase III subunit chi
MIIFITVTDNKSKLMQICSIVQRHFSEGSAIQINVPNYEAAQYIDKLLWSNPENSFIPHQTSETFTEERIVITVNSANLNNASVLLNLTPLTVPLPDTFQTIYEFMDLTSETKKQHSLQRKEEYQNKNFAISYSNAPNS